MYSKMLLFSNGGINMQYSMNYLSSKLKPVIRRAIPTSFLYVEGK